MPLTVTIEGTDRTESVVFPSFRKSEALNQEVDTAEFKVTKYGSTTYVPAIGDEVIVDRGSARIFGGVVVRVVENVEAGKVLRYTITCNDYSQFLKRQLVTQRYENTTVGAIIADLIGTYTTDGFTTDGVEGAQPIESIAFYRLSVADCLQKLADAISYVWYVDYDKDLHFFPKNTERGPNLTDTSQNYIYDSLEITADLTQVRNSITVQGGEAVSALSRTEQFNGDGTKVHFPLANKFSDLPTVTVGGVAQTVGVEFLDDDASFDCMWNYNEKYVRFTAGNEPAAGTNNVEVTGFYLYPIVVRVPAPASIAAYGEYGFAITDNSIRSQDEAIARARAELESYQNALYEGSFRTYSDGFRSGQVININSTQRGKNIDVLIQSVRAQMRDPNGDKLEYQVNFATLKSIGIIEFLQNQIRSKEVIVDDQETLLSYLAFTGEEIGMTDGIDAPTATSAPYVYAGAGGNEGRWGYATWG
jgi:hypothetical protein